LAANANLIRLAVSLTALQQPQPDGGELTAGQTPAAGECVAQRAHQPVGGGVHLARLPLASVVNWMGAVMPP
jgi:hypothetical protein